MGPSPPSAGAPCTSARSPPATEQRAAAQPRRVGERPDPPHRRDRQPPAAPVRHRHLHDASQQRPRRGVAGDRLLRGGDERSGPAARLSGPRAIRDRRSRRGVVPAGRRLSQRQRRRPGVRAARVRHLRRSVRWPAAAAAARAAHADRHDPAHHPRPAEPAAAPRHRRDRRDLPAAGRDEQPRRQHAGRRLRHRAGPHRRHSARHPRGAGQAREQAPPRRRGTDGPADVRAALAGQGHRVRDRRAAGDRGELSVRGLHRAGRHPSARQGCTRARPIA